MIHTATTLIFSTNLTDEFHKKNCLKQLINKMPIEELEKFCLFDSEKVEFGTRYTATIELIDV